MKAKCVAVADPQRELGADPLRVGAPTSYVGTFRQKRMRNERIGSGEGKGLRQCVDPLC